MPSVLSLSQLCQELQRLQRQRAVYIKSRIKYSNRLEAMVAGTMGYHSGMKESERQKVYTEARVLIKAVVKEEKSHELRELILVHRKGIDEFRYVQDRLEKEMTTIVKQLPVAGWVEEREQSGVSLDYLAVIIGETGDLFNYANPAKVWRRLGCAPYQFDGKTLMGATWRSGKEGKLPAEEWENFGYSPRRRSIAYMIGEGIIKANFRRDKETGEIVWTGPYRLRYDEAKERFRERHPEYESQKGFKLRCHLHGMLCATKLFLKNLWVEWQATGAV